MRAFLHGMTVISDAHQVTVSPWQAPFPSRCMHVSTDLCHHHPALIAGAFADRMKFSAMFGIHLGVVAGGYCPLAHWVWRRPAGWRQRRPGYAGGHGRTINAVWRTGQLLVLESDWATAAKPWRPII